MTWPGNVQTDNATPIVPTNSDACCASADTSPRERPQAAAAPATCDWQKKILSEYHQKKNKKKWGGKSASLVASYMNLAPVWQPLKI